ncbi:MAG: LLM class F420-dependent oxidoreductase [Caldilineaceae bacterium]|nr:LLM class F420-dependent oxidoreductase [Caldilineaceae bacterium]
MRLGLNTGYSGGKIALPMRLIREADLLGYYAVWTAEAYGSDAVSPLAWIGAQTERIHLGTAILQMAARTPAMTAMTAMTLDQLSGGRMLLGLGVSGPQVVEGWHGVGYARPLTRTREYVEVVRRIFAREEPLTFEGEFYQLPYHGPGSLGLGKPLKSILHGRVDLPIYLAAIGPQNVQLAAELADGWLPIFFAPEHYEATFAEAVAAGRKQAGEAGRPEGFDIAPAAAVVVGDDLAGCWMQLKPMLALYIGGMGSRGTNFYYNLACRYGFEEAADRIQTSYLAGDRAGAVQAVPDALVDAISLCGSRARIADRLQLWRTVPITTLTVMTDSIETVRMMAELVL